MRRHVEGQCAYARRVTDRAHATGTFLASETRHNYQYFDRNLRDAAAFTLDNEQGRAVFVPANTIPATGRTTARFAYEHPEFTHVLELVSTGRARARAAIVDGALRCRAVAGERRTRTIVRATTRRSAAALRARRRS